MTWKWQDHYNSEEEYASEMYSDAHKYCWGTRWVPAVINLATVWDDIDKLYEIGNERYDAEVQHHIESCVKTGEFPRSGCFQCFSKSEIIYRNWDIVKQLGYLGMLLHSKSLIYMHNNY